MSEPSKAWEFLEQAVKEMKGRKELYDPDKESDGERSMGKTVEMFNTLTDNELTEEQGWMFMVCLKMVRSQSGKYQADDYVDGAAYFGLGGEAGKKSRGKVDGRASGLGDEIIRRANESLTDEISIKIEKLRDEIEGRAHKELAKDCVSMAVPNYKKPLKKNYKVIAQQLRKAIENQEIKLRDRKHKKTLPEAAWCTNYTVGYDDFIAEALRGIQGQRYNKTSLDYFICTLCDSFISGAPCMFKSRKPVCETCFKDGINPIATGDS